VFPSTKIGRNRARVPSPLYSGERVRVRGRAQNSAI
jgi:hypothetical protein